MNYKIKIKKVKSKSIISIRTKCSIAELSKNLGESMLEVFNFVGQKGIKPRGAPVAIFHETKDSQTDVEVGIPIANPIKLEGRIQNNQTPKGKAAYTLYQGSYEKIALAYDAIKLWANKKGLKATGVWWEFYLTDPREEPDQNKWKTEIYCLLTEI